MSDNLRGALLMMAAMAAFTLSDTTVKLLSVGMPLSQLLFLRGLVTVAVFLALAWRLRALRLPTDVADRRRIVIRTLAEIGAAGLFLTALVNMPLANATAILQSLPLAITLAGALFLGEQVGIRRWTAVAIGFVGVLLIVRPGTEGFTVHALLALASVACVTLRDIVTRRMSPAVSSVAVALAAAVGVTLSAGLAGGVVGGWVAPGPRELALLAVASLCVIIGYLLSVMVMRKGEVSFVAPFRYTSIVWALLLGLVVFGDWPDALTLVGVAVVVGAGSFTLWRAGRKGAAPPPPQGP